MAQKRMFNTSVVGTDSFMEMPDSAQNLYFHLSMYADDDGFVDKWKQIMRMTGKKEDDMKILIAKSFIIPFDSGVIVIKHWRLNNYIQKDRYKETIHIAEKSMLELDESGVYTPCIQDVYKMDTQYSIDKNSIDKNNNMSKSDDIGRESFSSNDEPPLTPQGESLSKEEELIEDFEVLWERYPKKHGKNQAYNHYKAWLKGKKYAGKTTKLTREQMWYAIIDYTEKVKTWDKQYIKDGSTFFNNAICEYAPSLEVVKERMNSSG